VADMLEEASWSPLGGRLVPNKVPCTCLPAGAFEIEANGVLSAVDGAAADDPAAAVPDAGSVAGPLPVLLMTFLSKLERKAVGAALSRRTIVAPKHVVSKSRMPSPS
jgi:hypothetical protein